MMKFTEEEREVLNQIRANRRALEKEMEGMTNREKADYINKQGREVLANSGILERRSKLAVPG